MTWPNGGGVDLAPADYYGVRFTRTVGDVPAGAGGIVVDHLLSGHGVPGCVVEVGPFDEHGAPTSVEVVPADALALAGRQT